MTKTLSLSTAALVLLVFLTPVEAQDDEAAARLDFREVIRSATTKVFPAVAYVKCIRESHERGKKASEAVTGSGVLISPDGEMLTNWHVVDKAVEVRCLLHDGTPYYAKVLGSDKDIDLALLKLVRKEGAKPLPYASLGDSSALREGDFVMAMGAPWGMARSVTIGIVAALRRYLPGNSEYSLWLQTDAAISPGNSGGPLVNTKGEVVGINTRGIMYGGDIGFSIPAETIAIVVAQIRKHGKVMWSWTGLQLQPLHDFDKNIYFEADAGVIVSGTDPESPGRRAGLLPRDRILSIDGEVVTAVTEEGLPAVRRLLGMLPMGKPVKLVVVREEKTMEVELTPREKGDVQGEELDCPRFDFTAKTINQFDNPSQYFHKKKGVFVFGIKYPGNASSSRLRSGDILLKIDGEKVETLEDVKRIHARCLKNVDKKHRIVLSVLRNGLMQQVVLDFARDYERE